MTDNNIVDLQCADLAEALRVLGTVGFTVEMIMPADDPQVAVIGCGDVRLRLVRGDVSPPPSTELPPNVPELAIARGGAWTVGRAGMQYRDLIPNRHGGRFIASHIRISDGGPVPDYVHWHAIRFQMIYCYRGWVRLVYEDQGEPFTMNAGDCVIQPPTIRHRVLESSDGLEVIEVSCPAIHPTYADPQLALPSGNRPERVFDGQTFTLHRTADPYAARDLGIAAASRGVASARVVTEPRAVRHDHELLFGFVLRGEATLNGTALATTDAFTLPAGAVFELAGSPDLAWLEVTVH